MSGKISVMRNVPWNGNNLFEPKPFRLLYSIHFPISHPPNAVYNYRSLLNKLIYLGLFEEAKREMDRHLCYFFRNDFPAVVPTPSCLTRYETPHCTHPSSCFFGKSQHVWGVWMNWNVCSPEPCLNVNKMIMLILKYVEKNVGPIIYLWVS